jgi:hypothetical protein
LNGFEVGKNLSAMYVEGDAEIRLRGSVLGERARWGRVGYSGSAFSPAGGTYPGMNATRVNLTTIADSGRTGTTRAALINLYPLAAAALYEVAFAREAGPLSTWRN